MIVDKRIWFLTWVHGHYSGEFKTPLTEHGKHGSWHGFGMIWKTSIDIVSVFPSPGIRETDNIFGWDSLLWPPTVHPATEFSDYFALNLLKMFFFNGFFFMFLTSRWVDECHQYIIAHPPFFGTQNSQGFFHFPGGQLAQRWRGHFWIGQERKQNGDFYRKRCSWNLKLETIHDTLKKLDLFFKLQLTIELCQFLNNYYHSCFFSTWIGWKFGIDTFDMNEPWFKHRRPNACSWITFSSKASPHRQPTGRTQVDGNQFYGAP